MTEEWKTLQRLKTYRVQVRNPQSNDHRWLDVNLKELGRLSSLLSLEQAFTVCHQARSELPGWETRAVDNDPPEGKSVYIQFEGCY